MYIYPHYLRYRSLLSTLFHPTRTIIYPLPCIVYWPWQCERANAEPILTTEHFGWERTAADAPVILVSDTNSLTSSGFVRYFPPTQLDANLTDELLTPTASGWTHVSNGTLSFISTTFMRIIISVCHWMSSNGKRGEFKLLPPRVSTAREAVIKHHHAASSC